LARRVSSVCHGLCGLARLLHGAKKLGLKFTLTMASYNLIRLPKLIEAAT